MKKEIALSEIKIIIISAQWTLTLTLTTTTAVWEGKTAAATAN